MPDPNARALSTTELVAMVAALSALNALSIDMMLPALPDIGAHYAIANDNDRQLVIASYIAAFGVAQLAYGPLSDAFGRRSALVTALAIYVVGALLCALAPSFGLLLAARALQGLGAAATRVVSTAVVRDLTAGRRMAQVMSIAMTVFMIVPIIAPGIGQLVLLAAPWQWIFAALTFYALTILAWAFMRLPETLAAEDRTPFKPRPIAGAYAAVLSNRQTLGYIIASTFMSAALFAYISASEQIFVDVFDLGVWFPLAFAAVAVALTGATFLNSRIVMRYGMRRISHAMTLWFVAAAATHAALAALGASALWVFLPMLALTIGVFGMIGGNFNALAMEPMGRIAGSASALYGAITSAGGAILGAVIARTFDGTTLPFLVGLVFAGLATLAATAWTERGRLLRDSA